MSRYIIIFLYILVSLSGCFLFNNSKVILYTDEPAFLAYVEAFNASQNDYKVEIIYHQTPDRALDEKESHPDVIIGKWLAYPSYMQKCENLSSILGKDGIRPNQFYADLLKLGIYEKEYKAIPLSFSLPCIIFDKNMETENIPDNYISLDTIKAISLNFNYFKNNKLLKLGFSPFWNEDCLYLISVLYGTSFRTGTTSRIEWNTDALLKAIAFVKNWITEIKGGFEAENKFSKKYINAPPYQLIKEKKILFYLIDSNSFYKIQKQKKENINIRWFSFNEKIPVNDAIIFSCIPQKAQNKTGAKFFLKWFLKPEIQEKLLEITHFKRLTGVFGIAGGFSSLKKVNETYIPQHYPLFSKHIPLENSFIFPDPFPDNWETIKNNIIKPWLKEAIVTDNFKKKLEDQLIFNGE